MALLDRIRKSIGLDTGEGPIQGDVFKEPVQSTQDIKFKPMEEVSSVLPMSLAPRPIQSDVPLATEEEVAGATAPPTVGEVTTTPPAPSSMPESDLDLALSEGASLAEKEMKVIRDGMSQAMEMLTEQIKSVEGQDINVSELRKKTMEEFGITQETFQRISVLSEQMAEDNATLTNMETKRDQKLQRIDEGGFTTSRRVAEENRVKRDAQREMNPVVARQVRSASLSEALRGNVEMARSMTKDIVDIAVWDHQQSIQKIDRLFELKSSFIETLTSGELEILRVARTQNENEIKRISDEVSQKHDLMIQAASNGIMLNIDPIRTPMSQAVNQFARSVSAKVNTQASQSGIGTRTLPGTDVAVGLGDFLFTVSQEILLEEDPEKRKDLLQESQSAAIAMWAGDSTAQTTINNMFGKALASDDTADILGAFDLTLPQQSQQPEEEDEPGGLRKWWDNLWSGDDDNPTII